MPKHKWIIEKQAACTPIRFHFFFSFATGAWTVLLGCHKVVNSYSRSRSIHCIPLEQCGDANRNAQMQHHSKRSTQLLTKRFLFCICLVSSYKSQSRFKWSRVKRMNCNTYILMMCYTIVSNKNHHTSSSDWKLWTLFCIAQLNFLMPAAMRSQLTMLKSHSIALQGLSIFLNLNCVNTLAQKIKFSNSRKFAMKLGDECSKIFNVNVCSEIKLGRHKFDHETKASICARNKTKTRFITSSSPNFIHFHHIHIFHACSRL